jgi:16S rRNA (guanine527-N7)-methyltransferase
MIDHVLLKEGAYQLGVALDAAQQEQFNTYCKLLLEYNVKVNLTAIIEPYEVVVKHFIDSIAVTGLVKFPHGSSLIDIGTGGGFPGMVLKIIRPDLQVTLMDSQKKKLAFLEQLGSALGIQNTILHGRAEQAGVDAALRERFDFATARAVASLDVLCEYALPLIRRGGRFIALKGPHSLEETEKAQHAIFLLGGELSGVLPYELPDGSERRLICIEKISKTPSKYPRQRVKIAEKPL